jgi:hypothetical protein
MNMRVRLGIAVLAVVFGYAAFVTWKLQRVASLPPKPQPHLADMGAVKSDLFVFARAERAFYASAGRYAPMTELRTDGLLSLPPDTRWPYSYYISVPAPGKFFIVAVAQGPPDGRPVALAMNERMEMRSFEPHQAPHRHGTSRKRLLAL